MCFEDTGSKRRTSVCSQATVNTDPSGEYSRLKTAPWVRVLRYTESAGWMELYKLVIVRKLSRAGSTYSPRPRVRLFSQRKSGMPMGRPVGPAPPRLGSGDGEGEWEAPALSRLVKKV